MAARRSDNAQTAPDFDQVGADFTRIRGKRNITAVHE